MVKTLSSRLNYPEDLKEPQRLFFSCKKFELDPSSCNNKGEVFKGEKRMKDLEVGKERLKKGASLAFVKEGQVLYESQGKGVLPILEAYKYREKLKDSLVVDTVVGLCHAMISAKIGVKSIYGKVFSQTAIDFLEEKRIPFSYETLVDVILNQTGEDYCPMEKRAMESSNIEELLEKIDEFFREVRRK